jgi:hypothetical protein
MFFQKKSSTFAYLATFVIGAAAGAAAALWFAPMNGKKFQKKVNNVAEKVIDKVDDLQQSVRKLATA